MVVILVALSGTVPRLASAASSIPVGAVPFSSTLVGTNLYVSNSGGSTVTVIDTTSNTVTASITVGTGPDSSVLVGGRYLYVNNSRDNTVSVLDTTTNTIVGSPITVGQGPWSSTLVGTNLYVNNRNANSISIIDVNPSDSGTYNTVTGTVSLASSPYSSTLVGGRYLYLSNSNDNTVSVLDTTTNTIVGSPIAVGNGPWSSTLVGTNLYVNNSSDGTLSIIDTTTNTVVGSPFYLGHMGSWSSTLVGTNLYVNNNHDGTISIFDTTDNTVTGTISTAGVPVSSTLVGGRYLYVNEVGSGRSFIPVFDTTTNTLVPVPPPTLTTAVADYTVLTLTYDESLNTNSVPAPADFVVDDNSTPVTVSGVQVSGSTVVLTLASAVAPSDTVTVSYAPGTHPVEDMASNGALALSDQLVTVDNTSSRGSYAALDNGTLTGSTTQTIDYGSDGTPVTAVPDSGYEFVSWSDGSSQNPRTDTDVTSGFSVSASFAALPVAPMLQQTSGTNSGGGHEYVCFDPKATNYNTYPSPGNTVCEYAAAVQPLPAAAVASLPFARNLRRGSVGPDVKKLQIYLRLHGFAVVPEGEETAIFGSKTRKELSLFQSNAGITPDGVFGPKTRTYVNGHQ